MSKVKIDIISKVHIGTGEKLQFGSDFIDFQEGGKERIGIISPRKVMSIIGKDPKAVDAWIAAIERKQSIIDLMKTYAPRAAIDDYCSRIDQNSATVKDTDTLQTLIHDGQGRPYIPGSSLKGAIRTALLAEETKNQEWIKHLQNPNALKVEQQLFGNNPNEDIFRFLQVGDAYFGNFYEKVVRLVNINERQKSSYWDESKPQLAETLAKGDNSMCEIRLNLQAYRRVQGHVHALLPCMQSLETIFETINRHTNLLLEQEIAHWKERADQPNAENVEEYITKLKAIKLTAETCEKSKGHSCLLRLGAGSGWRFITGAWAEELDNFEEVIVPIARRNNTRYSEYDFPKSRRVDNSCTPLGFVCLTIMEK